MTISEQIKDRRIKLQLSQEQVANKIGISRRTLAYYESGERIPNAETLILLCNLYSLDINKLITTNIDNELEPISSNSDEVISKINDYLNYEQAKKKTLYRTLLYFFIFLSILVSIIILICMTLKFVLMAKYGFSFSEATAQMWTSLFNSLIIFVNDPTVKSLPLVTIFIESFIILSWIIFFIVKLIKDKKQK